MHGVETDFWLTWLKVKMKLHQQVPPQLIVQHMIDMYRW